MRNLLAKYDHRLHGLQGCSIQVGEQAKTLMTCRDVELCAVVFLVGGLFHTPGACCEDDEAECEMSRITLALFF